LSEIAREDQERASAYFLDMAMMSPEVTGR